MTHQSFTTTIYVDRSPEDALAAINNVRAWWSEEIEGATNKLGAEFTYRSEDAHRCRMKIIEFNRDERVVWLVLDNHFNFTEDQTETMGVPTRKSGRERLDDYQLRSGYRTLDDVGCLPCGLWMCFGKHNARAWCPISASSSRSISYYRRPQLREFVQWLSGRNRQLWAGGPKLPVRLDFDRLCNFSTAVPVRSRQRRALIPTRVFYRIGVGCCELAVHCFRPVRKRAVILVGAFVKLADD